MVWTEIARTTVYKGGRENITYQATLTKEDLARWDKPTKFLFIRMIGPNVPGVAYSIIECDCKQKKYRTTSYSQSADFYQHLLEPDMGPWTTPVKGTIGEILYKKACK